MNYSLGNMLSRGGSLNADGLSLDLQFAADKTLTARKGPTPVFTRASTATFIGSDGLIQSAAINAARFDHDPITLACKGLLIEESRTNILRGNSQNLSGSGWSGLGLANNDPLIADPTGTVGGVYYVSVNERLCNFNGSGTVVCLSFFAKQRTGGGTGVTIQVFQQTSPSAILIGTQQFLFTGTMTPSTNFTSLTRTAYPNGWYRFTAVLTAPSGSFNSSARIDIEGGVSSNYTWGFQVEAAAFATSYIPTTTGSVIRSADICSITGSDFTSFYNEFAGTVLCESTLNGVSPSVTPITARLGDEQNEIRMQEASGISSLTGFITYNANLAFNSSMAGSSFGVARKSAMAFQDAGSAILCLNGTLGTQDNSVFLPRDATGGVTPTELNLFRGQFTTVKSFRYYKKRLANAKLQSLTT
jgi:hypothetical protein